MELQSLAVRAAVHCRLLAGDFVEAEPLIRELIKELPKDATLWRKLTLCLIKLERMAEAAVAFVEYSGRQPDGNDDIWLSPLVMHLGAQAMTHETVATAIENAALFAPARQLGERLMQWYAPWTTSMCVPALRKWWVGLYIVGAGETHQNIGEGVWEHAIVCFAEAVVLELKAKVFIPAGDLNKQMIASIPDTWRQAFAGRATLGQSVECLLQTRTPQSPPAKALRHFIDTRVPGLNAYLARSGRELDNLNALRRRAQHGDLDSRSAPPPPLTKTDTEQSLGPRQRCFSF